MHIDHRPRKQDWIPCLVAGGVLGALFLGVGGRAGMRVIALAGGQAPFFSLAGSLTVIALGALTGAVVAAIFLIVRILLPNRRGARATLFWIVCGALMLRGLNPVTPQRLVVFLPLLGLHGVSLHLYWCRIHLARRRGASPDRPSHLDGLPAIRSPVAPRPT